MILDFNRTCVRPICGAGVGRTAHVNLSNRCSIRNPRGFRLQAFMSFFNGDHLEWSNNHFAWIERVFDRFAGLSFRRLLAFSCFLCEKKIDSSTWSLRARLEKPRLSIIMVIIGSFRVSRIWRGCRCERRGCFRCGKALEYDSVLAGGAGKPRRSKRHPPGVPELLWNTP